MTPLIYKAMARGTVQWATKVPAKEEALTRYVVKVLRQSVHPPPHCTPIPKGPLLQASQARPGPSPSPASDWTGTEPPPPAGSAVHR